jgi:hypothetical protein
LSSEARKIEAAYGTESSIAARLPYLRNPGPGGYHRLYGKCAPCGFLKPYRSNYLAAWEYYRAYIKAHPEAIQLAVSRPIAHVVRSTEWIVVIPDKARATPARPGGDTVQTGPIPDLDRRRRVTFRCFCSPIE